MAAQAQNIPAVVGQAVAPPAQQQVPAPAQAQVQAPAPAGQGLPSANLPGRSERSAPSFDDSQPEELERYFADLQVLFDRYAVVDDQERKQAALKYLKIRTESLWKTTEAWADQTKTYEEFKTEVFTLYPGATGDRTYTIQDLDMLIGHFARVGILNSIDLGDYYRRFLLISRFLISKGCLSTQEQSRSFLRGLQPQLEAQVKQRLQLKFIDHCPDDPYDFAVIYEAVSYVLRGSTSTMAAPIQGISPTAFSAPVTSPVQDPTQVKLEALTAAIASLGEVVKTALQAQTQQAGAAKPRNQGPAAAGTGGPSQSVCNFCGVPGHFIRECEIVEEFIRFGKCKRNPEGKVVLPSGAMVPRSITGTWLRDRVEEWHRQNPGQLAAQMLFEVATARAVTALPNDAAGQAFISYPTSSVSTSPGIWPARTYALKRQLPPRPEVVITTQPPHRRGRAGQGENAGGASSGEDPEGQDTEPPPPAKETPSAVKKGKRVEFAPEHTHPYAAAPDATYAPVTEQARPAAKEPAAGRHEPGYHNTAKVYDPQVAKAVYERAMETPITVTQRELLSLAPEVRNQMADATIRKRVPREPAVQAVHRAPVAHAMIEEVPDEDDPDSVVLGNEDSTQLTHMPAAFAAAARAPPPDATIIADPYEAYLRENAGSINPNDPNAVVAAESSALRAILPVVDGQDKVEAILDPGCQIVAMSEEVCNALALHYDPTIRLNMMSANGGIDQSLGLSRNVPFLVGDITVYLQVHVLRNPAYDILLGRPFDVLTQSVVRNFPDENQTITILDPNTGRKATIPTIPRGSHRFADRRVKRCPNHSQDF
jgi:hypothetical protein